MLIFGAAIPLPAAEPAAALTQYARTLWTEQSGLSPGPVQAIVQDRDGYLWLGTGAGLVRFDGVRFSVWGVLPQGAIATRSVTALCVSRDGSLWIGFDSGGGLSRLRDGRLTHYGVREGLLEDKVKSLLEDYEGTIWMGQSSGLWKHRDDRWERVDAQHGFPAQELNALYEDRRGTLWVSTTVGMYRRIRGEDTFSRFSALNRVQAFSEDNGGTIWVTGPGLGLKRLDGPMPTRAPGLGKDVYGWSLLHDRQGNLWFGTRGQGLFRASSQKHPSILQPERVWAEHDVVSTLLEDREGNIWVGSQRGLNRLSDTPVKSVPTDVENGIRGLIRSVAVAPDGGIWASSTEGLYRLSDAGVKRYDRRHGLPNLSTLALHSDQPGTMWVATSEGVFRLRNGRFIPLPLPRTDQPYRIVAITTDARGALWMCDLDRGLFRWKSGHLTTFPAVPELGGKPPVFVYADRSGRVWIGLPTRGLALYQQGHFRFYSEKDGLTGGRVRSIFEDRHGTIWVGMSGGLSRFEHGRFVTLTGKHGLPGNSVEAIIEDDERHLWLGLSTEIIRLPVSEFDKAVATQPYGIHYVRYDSSDGLRGNPLGLIYPNAARADDGTLWFVTSDGLAVVDPRRRQKDRLPVPVRIEHVVANDRPFDPTPQLRLPALTSRLQIDYTGLSLTTPAKVRFRYRLEGFDSNWVEAGTRRQAFYTNLPPGTYRFRVVATEDDVWHESGGGWEFSIQPTVWQTRWFFAACVVVAAASVWGAWQLRVRQVHRRLALVLAERERMAREIHDTLLQGMVGVGLQIGTAMSALNPSVQSAKEELDRLYTQVEQYIREARRAIWDLRSPTLETRDLPTALREAGERITAGKALHFELDVRGTPHGCEPKVEQQLLRIGQEAIGNAVLHAEATQVQVELSYGRQSVTLRIRDNGRGFDPTDPAGAVQDHWGLAGMQERAQQISAHFGLTSHKGWGTEIEIVALLSVAKVG
jgi:ligand-binding sensor domain-containing protein/signal transduction histidine kinase